MKKIILILIIILSGCQPPEINIEPDINWLYNYVKNDIITNDKIALFGDSRISWVDPYEFNITCYNYAWSGSTTRRIMNQLNDRIDTTPYNIIIINVGWNDLYYYPEYKYWENLAWIFNKLKETNIGDRIIMLSVLTGTGQYIQYNQYLIQVDQKLRIFCTDYGIEYIDLYPDFTDENLYLKPEFTYDGCHYNTLGQELFYQIIRSQTQ